MFVFVALASPAMAQSNRVVTAVRVDGPVPVIDGRLEQAWFAAAPATGFIQRWPSEGKPAVEETEVRFLYGSDALYIGARMHSSTPRQIQAALARRDNVSQAEALLVSFDPYLDRHTAFTFGITAAGTRLDWYHPSDSEDDTDASFDPVWEGSARIDSAGWVAELRIPYSQLRFNRAPVQQWGINIRRSVPARNEESYWVMVPRSESGWSSRFGRLGGMAGIDPGRHIELLPYLASGATLRGAPHAANPFDSRAATDVRAGGDVKAGLGPNLTLEATVNPDFGQVESDPAVVNLSDYEVFFDERRPFFTEGRQLLQGNGQVYFYSRRIGAGPRGELLGSARYSDLPATSAILGAAKITGRASSGTSIGALGAVTGSERARTFDTATRQFGSVPAAPAAGYLVVRGQQDVGEQGSTVGVTATAVRRAFGANVALADFLPRTAIAGGWDGVLYSSRHAYRLTASAGGSVVQGTRADLVRLQRSSARYFQRPDAHHVSLDSTRTSLSGYAAALDLSRVSGRHWLWTLSGDAESPGFEINDAGQLSQADAINGSAILTYRETRPGKLLRDYQFSSINQASWNFGGTRTFATNRVDGSFTFPNYWWLTFSTWRDFRSHSDRLTRGGPLMDTPQFRVLILNTGNNKKAPVRGNARIYYGRDELGGLTMRLSGGVTVRPAPRWEMSLAPNYLRVTDLQQYVSTLGGGPAATGGRRYVFATIDRATLLADFRLTYAFTPGLTLELYGEPFAASGRYRDFGELAAPRDLEKRRYTGVETAADGSVVVTDAGQQFSLARRDFRVLSFRSNAVLRWEWRPGSTLFVVWQQSRNAETTDGRLIGPVNLWDAVESSGDNILVVKATFWINLR